ncbi:GNAT family N-acetyltransferase [Bifidobacterium leontopitheci]|uniref:GNAT family acetyltransferase n=1 Tax=Bifidobacterium leontopitheci TaxID=2650774 RepID=A0A6I1GJR7_9BIFI|nr:hypothetical protein [Bifidobacterium leontopitheci]KAB7790992.1 GNAT family acetyltransferase [Bifidobacterium leontopitheci]
MRARAFDLFAKFPAEETGFENPAAGMSREQFAAYVEGLRDEALGIGLPDGWVPATKYILVNDEGEYVGIFNLRHRLTDFLREGPGHIGYGIAREYRGHGYATAGLINGDALMKSIGIPAGSRTDAGRGRQTGHRQRSACDGAILSLSPSVHQSAHHTGESRHTGMFKPLQFFLHGARWMLL